MATASLTSHAHILPSYLRPDRPLTRSCEAALGRLIGHMVISVRRGASAAPEHGH